MIAVNMLISLGQIWLQGLKVSLSDAGLPA
jgi:hypothetical protein